MKASTLVKIREMVDETRERLDFALQVLQLDTGIKLTTTMNGVATDVRDIAVRTANMEGTLAQVATQNQQLLSSHQSDEVKKIMDWLAPPDPLTNHNSALHKREALSGTWLLQSKQYTDWKAGTIKHLWLFGKAGCGKTVLSSTIVEDMQMHCKTLPSVGHAYFYFSFSDDRKQAYEDLLRSLTFQLAWKEPGWSMLQNAFGKPGDNRLRTDELEKIVLASMSSYSVVHLQLDALDECPESGEVRQDVLEGLEGLTQQALHLKIFATSRELRDVQESMDQLKATAMFIPTRAVDLDIQEYVSAQVSRDRRLQRLSPAIKSLIQDTVAQRSDGM